MSFFSQGNFNAAEVEPETGFAPIPVGDYVAVIAEAEEIQKTFRCKNTGNDVPGIMLKVVVEICQGPQEGRKLFDNLCLQHPSQQAQEIALQRLSSICRAVGVMTPKNTQELCNKPIDIKVKHEKRKDTGEMSARVASYKQRTAPSAPKPKPASGPSYEAGLDDDGPF